MSIRPNLAQAVVVYAKVMSQFVADDVLNRRARLLSGAALQEDWLTVDADLVWQDKVVTLAAFGERNAVIKAQERGGMTYPGQPQRLAVGPVLHDDLHVVQPFAENVGQTVEGFRYGSLKLVGVHNKLIVSANHKSDTST
jgi:hypothetical protein